MKARESSSEPETRVSVEIEATRRRRGPMAGDFGAIAFGLGFGFGDDDGS